MRTENEIAMLPVETPDGVFAALYSARGLLRLEFPSGQKTPRTARGNVLPVIQDWHSLTCRAVRNVLSGECPGNLPPLDLSAGTSFQRRVWEALRRLPPGAVATYGRLAAGIHAPKAARAVGAACGANPIPLLIPCHRVIASNGGLGGFSGGLHWKRSLLAREAPDRQPRRTPISARLQTAVEQ